MATIKKYGPMAALIFGLIAAGATLGAVARVARHSPPQCNHTVFIESAHGCLP